MREFDLDVDGVGKVHVRQETADRFLGTIPGGLKQECDPLTGQCSFGTPFNGCTCEPWNCPERVEQWAKRYDVEMEKLYNLKPEQRDLSFLKARLAQRCATNHHGNPKPVNDEDVHVVVDMRRRLEKEAPPEEPEWMQEQDFETFLKACVDAGNDPQQCRLLWKQKHPTEQGEERQATANFEKDENPDNVKPSSAEEAVLIYRYKKRLKKNARK